METSTNGPVGEPIKGAGNRKEVNQGPAQRLGPVSEQDSCFTVVKQAC